MRLIIRSEESMRVRIRTRTIASVVHNAIEVELTFVPSDKPKVVQPTLNTLIIGYLVHDEACGNPMKDNDAEGTLYTLNEGVITDDKSAPSYLGLTEFGGSYYGPEYDLEHAGISERIAQYIHAKIQESPQLTAWMVAKMMETEENHNTLVSEIMDWMQGYRNTNHDWYCDEDCYAITALGDYETLAKKAWKELYNEGKIGAYLAVPVRYIDNNHGPGTTTIRTASLEDANAVWVPDGYAQENMNFDDCPTYLEKLAVAEKYASSTLENYANWCNGDCWGVVVETFALEDGVYVRQEEDSCWGFIGSEYAEKELGLNIEHQIKEATCPT